MVGTIQEMVADSVSIVSAMRSTGSSGEFGPGQK